MLRSLGAKPDGVQTCHHIWRIGIPRSPNREILGRRGNQRPRGGASPRTRILPYFVWDALAALLSGLANPPLTRDQVKLMKSDNVVGETTLTLEDLGIDPTPVEELLPTYIYHSGKNHD